jgi:hypothetical protein
MTPKAFHAPFGRIGSAKMRNATSPWSGLAYAQFNERTVRIKDSADGLFRCGAFGAACVAVHRSDIREWYPPGPDSHPTLRSLIRFRLL